RQVGQQDLRVELASNGRDKGAEIALIPAQEVEDDTETIEQYLCVEQRERKIQLLDQGGGPGKQHSRSRLLPRALGLVFRAGQAHDLPRGVAGQERGGP